MNYSTALEQNTILPWKEWIINPTTWMISKDIMLSEEVSLKRLQTVIFHLCEKAVMRENRSVAARMHAAIKRWHEGVCGAGVVMETTVSWLW